MEKREPTCKYAISLLIEKYSTRRVIEEIARYIEENLAYPVWADRFKQVGMIVGLQASLRDSEAEKKEVSRQLRRAQIELRRRGRDLDRLKLTLKRRMTPAKTQPRATNPVTPGAIRCDRVPGNTR